MIDLHSHILPGLDDGAPDIDASLEMARRAVAEGIHTMVATPHISSSYPVDPAVVGPAVGALNVALARSDIPLGVLSGAEITISKATDMDDFALRSVTLGGSDCLLLESPYRGSVPFLDRLVFELETRGFRTVLAHPERSSYFQGDVTRLEGLVQRGAMTSVTAASMAGRFGRTVQRFTVELFRRGLVHDVASDAHDVAGRAPGLAAGFAALEHELPGIDAQREWYTRTAPESLLAGEQLPARPAPPQPAPNAWQRLTRRNTRR